MQESKIEKRGNYLIIFIMMFLSVLGFFGLRDGHEPQVLFLAVPLTYFWKRAEDVIKEISARKEMVEKLKLEKEEARVQKIYCVIARHDSYQNTQYDGWQ